MEASCVVEDIIPSPIDRVSGMSWQDVAVGAGCSRSVGSVLFVDFESNDLDTCDSFSAHPRQLAWFGPDVPFRLRCAHLRVELSAVQERI